MLRNCTDCIHYNVCQYHIDEETTMTINECGSFKDKDRMIELPCNVGDVVYYITGIHGKLIGSAKIEKIVLNYDGIYELYVYTQSGTYFEDLFANFYLTKEEADRTFTNKEITYNDL